MSEMGTWFCKSSTRPPRFERERKRKRKKENGKDAAGIPKHAVRKNENTHDKRAKRSPETFQHGHSFSKGRGVGGPFSAAV